MAQQPNHQTGGRATLAHPFPSRGGPFLPCTRVVETDGDDGSMGLGD